MSIIKVDYGEIGGGESINPTIKHHNERTDSDSYVIDPTKKYLSVACILLDDSYTRMGVAYIDNGTLTIVQNASYCYLTISGSTTYCNIGANVYAEWTVIQLD